MFDDSSRSIGSVRVVNDYAELQTCASNINIRLFKSKSLQIWYIKFLLTKTIGHYQINLTAFWNIYPRNEKKMLAWNVWQRDQLEPLADKIVEGVRAYRASEAWQKENGKFVPHPTTFLNQRMYLDKPKVKPFNPFEQ